MGSAAINVNFGTFRDLIAGEGLAEEKNWDGLSALTFAHEYKLAKCMPFTSQMMIGLTLDTCDESRSRAPPLT